MFVDDLDDTLARATARGATIVQPPTDVGAMGRMGMFTDPSGALTALFGPPVGG